jgi:hypothetical protein
MHVTRTNHRSAGARRAAFCAAAAAAVSAFGAVGAAQAVQIDTGNPDLSVRWDNTVRYNYAHRVEGQDPKILASPNADDGDRNFDKGMVSNRLDLLSEFDVVYQRSAGFRVSASAWADQAYRKLDNDSAATSNHLEDETAAIGLSDATRRFHKGPSGEILDAFVFGGMDVGDMSFSVKAGRHTVYWGEALLSPFHGVNYGQAPLDLRKMLSVPGTEVKELLLPRNSISAQFVPTPELSFSAQYFLDWKPFRIPEAGSYLGGYDMLLEGGESIIAGPGVRLLRGSDVKPQKRGDWGLSTRWSPDWLDGTLGVYYRNTADIQPHVHVRPAVATLPSASCTALGFAALAPTTCYINPDAATPAQLGKGIIGQYHLVYPGDVDIVGLSLSKNVAGVSVGAEVSYRQNMPLASEAVTVFSSAPGSAALAAATPGATTALPGEGQTGGAVGDTWHGVFNLLGTVSRTPLFDAASWITEVQWNRWDKVRQGEAVFTGRDGYTGVDKASKDFYGLAVNFTATWFQVFPGVDLSMPLSYSVGLHGTSAVGVGGNEDAGSYSVGLAADAYQKYRFELRYVDFFGPTANNADGSIASSAGPNALISDRGFVSLTFKTTF